MTFEICNKITTNFWPATALSCYCVSINLNVCKNQGSKIVSSGRGGGKHVHTHTYLCQEQYKDSQSSSSPKTDSSDSKQYPAKVEVQVDFVVSEVITQEVVEEVGVDNDSVKAPKRDKDEKEEEVGVIGMANT